MIHRIRNNMLLAIHQARTFEHDNPYHFGGVLSKKSRIFATGVNRYISHPKSKTRYKFVHCEHDLLMGFSKFQTIGCEVYLARMGFKHRRIMMNSKPCKHCQALLIEYGIKRIYYTSGANKISRWDLNNEPEELNFNYDCDSHFVVCD